MDWADKLIAKMRKRGENHTAAEALREEVRRLCEGNIKRWSGEKQWNAVERAAATEKEMKRLIKLKRDEDKRDQLRFDYKGKGIEIEPDYSQYGKIGSVRLPFTPEEWTDLLNKEGEHLGMCCADISRIRDILQDACRNDYYVEVEHLFEAAHLAKHHGFKIGDDPIGRMIFIWNKVKDDARVRSDDHSADTNSPEDALHVLYTSAGVICWDNIKTKKDQCKDSAFERHTNYNYALATAQVAVRTLYLKMREMDPGPIEGYGLVRQDGEVGHSRRGLAVFRTEESAREICDRWNASEDKEYKTGRHKKKRMPHVYTVKKIRVSMEHGLEILQDDHEIQVTQDVRNCPEQPEPIEF